MDWPIKLTEQDKEVFEIFNIVQSQAIFAGMDGMPVDLDFRALEFVFDLYEIEDRKTVFERVIKLWRHVIKLQRDKAKNGD